MITLAPVYQDYMTIQRDKPVRICGTASADERASVFLNDRLLVEVLVKEGEVEFYLPSLPACFDAVLRIRGEQSDLVFHHVDIGEVWIAGGESNMSFELRFDQDGEQMIAQADDPHFRYYQAGRYAYKEERQDCLKDQSGWETWLSFKPETASKFSAAAVWFALKLRASLNVPVAVIGCNYPGTSALSWTSREVLKSDPEMKVYLDEYIAAASGQRAVEYRNRDHAFRASDAKYLSGEAYEHLMKQEARHRTSLAEWFKAQRHLSSHRPGPQNEHRPGGLFDTMVKSLYGYSVRGVLWYQGESDTRHAELYGRLLGDMIGSWRRYWRDPMPFLLVPPAPFENWLTYDGEMFPLVRSAHQRVSEALESVWVVSLMDAGSRYDLHPKNKKVPGLRMALLALNKVYGKNILAEAPCIRKIRRSGQRVELWFENAPGGLEIRCADLRELFSVTKDGKNIPFKAEAEGDMVILTLRQDVSDALLSFSYMPYCVTGIYNLAGLAARPLAPVKI